MDPDALFSGWGLRTMSKEDGGYNPIEYHNGTVWPHDNSLIAYGLARYGFREEANRVAEAILESAPYFGYRLPEVFAGYRREETRFPVVYPTSCSPQAWAAGTPPLLARAMLGLEPDPEARRLLLDPALPRGVSRLRLHGVPAFGERHTVGA
jgi:glycogen debranching enzyme